MYCSCNLQRQQEDKVKETVMQGRALFIRHNKEIIVVMKLPSEYNDPKDYNMEDKKEGEVSKPGSNVALYDVIDSGIADCPVFEYIGKPAAEHTVGFSIENYVIDGMFWVTQEEFEQARQKGLL